MREAADRRPLQLKRSAQSSYPLRRLVAAPAAVVLRAVDFAIGFFFALARIGALRLVLVVAMGPPLLTQANHLQREGITVDSTAQVLVSVKEGYRTPGVLRNPSAKEISAASA